MGQTAMYRGELGESESVEIRPVGYIYSRQGVGEEGDKKHKGKNEKNENETSHKLFTVVAYL